MERSGPAVTSLRLPAGAAQEEHLLLQRNAFLVGLYHPTFARLRVTVSMWSQNVCRLNVSLLVAFYLTVSGLLTGGVWVLWPADIGEHGTRCYHNHLPWQLLRPSMCGP